MYALFVGFAGADTIVICPVGHTRPRKRPVAVLVPPAVKFVQWNTDSDPSAALLKKP